MISWVHHVNICEIVITTEIWYMSLTWNTKFALKTVAETGARLVAAEKMLSMIFLQVSPYI